jgi:hypothetical protein
MLSREKLSEFTEWCANHIKRDKKAQAQIFSDSQPLESWVA